LDTFLVDFNYLKRNTLTNAVNISLLANAPPTPEPVYHNNQHGNLDKIEFVGIDSAYEHRIGVRKANSTDLYFDTVITFSSNAIIIKDISPKGDVQIHCMNFDGEIESIPSVIKKEAFLGLNLEEERQLDCIELYPNPNDGHFNARWRCSLRPNSVQLFVFDTRGSLKAEKTIEYGSVNDIDLVDLSHLSPGMYQLKFIINQEESFIKNIIVQ